MRRASQSTRPAARGIDQYVILGAGFDTFALRRADLVDRVQVFEVDHPDAQRLKRERIEATPREPASLPEFVPVDFEATSLGTALEPSGFDPKRPAVFSWLNTLPYLTEGTTEATLEEIARLAAPGSRLVLNYSPAVELTQAQSTFLATVMSMVVSEGEPFRIRPDLAAGRLHAVRIPELELDRPLSILHAPGREAEPAARFVEFLRTRRPQKALLRKPPRRTKPRA